MAASARSFTTAQYIAPRPRQRERGGERVVYQGKSVSAGMLDDTGLSSDFRSTPVRPSSAA